MEHKDILEEVDKKEHLANLNCKAGGENEKLIFKILKRGEKLNLETANTEDDLVDKCIEVIGSEAKRRTEIVPSTASYDIGRYASFPVEVQVGGATIFVLDVEQFKKL